MPTGKKEALVDCDSGGGGVFRNVIRGKKENWKKKAPEFYLQLDEKGKMRTSPGTRSLAISVLTALSTQS